jgi:CTP:molybdopterin cytidylyltransferase MocA
LIGGLILAAGAGERFGEAPKLLAELEGKPLLEHAIDVLCAVSELQRVVVVLGANAAGLLAAVHFDHAEPVICEDWRDGQSASLRFGIEELRGAEKVVVMLGDAPVVTAVVVRRLLGAEPPARAVYGGRPGHPVLLGRAELRATSSLTGDHGARDLLGSAELVECSDLCSGRDVDTPHDLEAIRDEARAIL